MPERTSKTGSELFIVDKNDADWKVLRYLHDWCQISLAENPLIDAWMEAIKKYREEKKFEYRA